jgi:hypothetical protein
MGTGKLARCYDLYRGQIQHEDLLYARHLVALENSEHPGERRDLSQTDVAAQMYRIHEREGLPPLVTRRLYSTIGLVASVFFGPVFASAWIVLIFPLQHLPIALALVILFLLLPLVELLPGKSCRHLRAGSVEVKAQRIV